MYFILVMKLFPQKAGNQSWRPEKNKKTKKLFVCGFVFQGRHNKLPQIGWLNTAEVYSLKILDARVCKQGFGRALLPPKALRENPCLVASNPYYSLVCSCISPISVSVITSPFSLCVPLCPNPPLFSPRRLQSLDWRPTPRPYDLVLTWLHLQWCHFQKRSHSQVSGLGFGYIFWGVHTEPHVLYISFIQQYKVICGPPYAAIWHMDCALKARLQKRKGMDVVRWQEPQEWDGPQDTLLSTAVKKNRLVANVLICT